VKPERQIQIKAAGVILMGAFALAMPPQTAGASRSAQCFATCVDAVWDLNCELHSGGAQYTACWWYSPHCPEPGLPVQGYCEWDY
jgi:hypothetical protein